MVLVEKYLEVQKFDEVENIFTYRCYTFTTLRNHLRRQWLTCNTFIDYVLLSFKGGKLNEIRKRCSSIGIYL